MNKLNRLLLAVILALGLAPLTKAQNMPTGLTMGTTVNANISAGQTYFYLLLSGGSVTTFNFTSNTGNPVNPQLITVVFQQDSSGSRTVGYGSMFSSAATCAPNATANKYTICTFFYDSASQLWYNLALAHN